MKSLGSTTIRKSLFPHFEDQFESPQECCEIADRLQRSLRTRSTGWRGTISGTRYGDEYRIQLVSDLDNEGRSAPIAKVRCQASEIGSRITVSVGRPLSYSIPYMVSIFGTAMVGAVCLLVLIVNIAMNPINEVSPTAWGLGIGVTSFCLVMLAQQLKLLDEPSPVPLVSELKRIIEPEKGNASSLDFESPNLNV